MIRISKNGLLIDRVFLQVLLNIVFEDATRPRAVLTLERSSPEGKHRIYSSDRQPVIV
jgi:hypothetical protein